MKAKARDEMLASGGIKWERPVRVLDLATGEIMPPSFITINSVKLLKRFALVALLLGLVAIGYGIGAVTGSEGEKVEAPVAMHITLTSPVTLVANLTTGEWECVSEHGTIKVITAYIVERDSMNIVSERSASGGMVSLNPTDNVKACHGWTS